MRNTRHIRDKHLPDVSISGVHSFFPFFVSAPQVSRSACLMTTQLICKLLRSREAAAAVDVRTWPLILDTGQHLDWLSTCICLLWSLV